MHTAWFKLLILNWEPLLVGQPPQNIALKREAHTRSDRRGQRLVVGTAHFITDVFFPPTEGVKNDDISEQPCG
jgi:hypothetical protein